MIITKSCGCSTKPVAENTVYAGYIKTYCNTHSPYKNIAERQNRV